MDLEQFLDLPFKQVRSYSRFYGRSLARDRKAMRDAYLYVLAGSRDSDKANLFESEYIEPVFDVHDNIKEWARSQRNGKTTKGRT